MYNFKRFLNPAGKDIKLSIEGFLPDPDNQDSIYYNSNDQITTYDSISNKPCLIILGEPGSGKTTLLKEITTQHIAENKKVLYIELKGILDEISLNEEIFEADAIKNIQRDKSSLYLILDALDETPDPTRFAERIINKLKKLPIQQIFIRLSCRSNLFSDYLLDKFADLYDIPKEEIPFIKYELAPLRQKDIEEYAQTQGINDSQDFVRKLRSYNITGFAIKPITLKPLIKQYIDGNLSSNQVDIYYTLCKELCNEINEFRINQAKQKGFIPKLNTDEKLYIAGRVAVELAYMQKSKLYIGDVTSTPTNCINIDVICSGIDKFNSKELPITRDLLFEVFDTAIFCSGGNNIVEFYHKTYQEFLAAWYLNQQNLKVDDLFEILTYSDLENKVIPQLYEISSWLASINKELLNKILECDPEPLIRSSVVLQDKCKNQEIIDKLFELISNKKLDFHFDNRLNSFRKLNHGLISVQIKKYLDNPDEFIKYTAIDIIFANKLTNFDEELFNIAANREEKMTIRAEALEAIEEVGSNEIKAKLYAKIDDFKEDFEKLDKNDQLKGAYLSALYPEFLSSKEAFSFLSEPKEDHFFGNYKNFIHYKLIQNLNKDSIIEALNWVNSTKWDSEDDDRMASITFEGIEKDIYDKATDFLELENVKDVFAKSLYVKLKNNHWWLNNRLEKLYDCTERLQEVIEHILLNYLESDDEIKAFVRVTNFYKKISEIPQLVNKYKNGPNKDKYEKVLEFYPRNWLISKEDHQQKAIFDDFNSDPALFKFDKFNYSFDEHKKEKEFILTPPPKERVQTMLENAENKDVNFFHRLIMEMTLEPNDRNYGTPSLIIEENPGWKDANEEIRQRILNVATKYLQEAETPDIKHYVNSNQFQYSWFAVGYILLIKDIVSQEELKTILSRWIGTILIIPTFGNDSDKVKELVCLSYKVIPEVTIDKLLQIIKLIPKATDPQIFRYFNYCWDSRLSETLFEFLKENGNKLSYQCYANIIEELLNNNFEPAKEFAEKIVKNTKSNSTPERKKLAKELIIVLSLNIDNTSWSTIWNKIILGTENLGKEIMISIASRERHNQNFLEKLNVRQLAELFIWIEKNLPSSEFKRPVSGWVTGEMNLDDLRWHILNHLRDNGLTEGFNIIKSVNPNNIKEEYWFDRYIMDTTKRHIEAIGPKINYEKVKTIINKEDRYMQKNEFNIYGGNPTIYAAEEITINNYPNANEDVIQALKEIEANINTINNSANQKKANNLFNDVKNAFKATLTGEIAKNAVNSLGQLTICLMNNPHIQSSIQVINEHLQAIL